jgi:DNA adenine methylase
MQNRFKPLTPPAAWQGGKSHLATTITSIIERAAHDVYAEPFIGMGGIFFRRPNLPKLELINDINAEIVCFFRVLQSHYGEFARHLRFAINARETFDQLKALTPESLTDIQRAVRFYYLQRLAFGGKIRHQAYGTDLHRARFNIRKLKIHLEQIHERLSSVVIERMPFADFMRHYDSPEILFYCDPPYYDCETDYGTGIFSKADFSTLADIMRAAKGKVMVSINDVPQVREIFSGFHFIEVSTIYTLGDNSKKASELVICNFVPEEKQARLL